MDLLEQLEQEFGVSEVRTASINLYNHKWTLRKLDYGDVDKSNQLIFKSGSEDMQTEEGTVEPAIIGFKTSLGFVALALAAIDDQPTCLAFKACTKEELGPFDPLAPPKSIRHRTADRVFAFFQSVKRRMDLVSQLFEFYTTKLDTEVLAGSGGAEEGTEANPLSVPSPTPPSSDG